MSEYAVTAGSVGAGVEPEPTPEELAFMQMDGVELTPEEEERAWKWITHLHDHVSAISAGSLALVDGS